jgi:hypothetical protein
VRFRNGNPVVAGLLGGTCLTAGQAHLTQPEGFVTGKLLGWDDTNPADTILKVDAKLPGEGLIGKYILIDNREHSDASYRIEGLPGSGRLSIGCNSLAERFVDRQDYSKGIICNVSPGDAFHIALSKVWQSR